MRRNKCRRTADDANDNGSRPKAYANPGSTHRVLHTEADNNQYISQDINPSRIGTRNNKCRGTANDKNDIRSRPKTDTIPYVRMDIILPTMGVVE